VTTSPRRAAPGRRLQSCSDSARAAARLRGPILAGCRFLNLEVEAEGLFYQAAPNFSGSDEVVYQVTRSDGRNQLVTIKIAVRGAVAPGQQPKQEATDL
jgi:hypothetical protein